MMPIENIQEFTSVGAWNISCCAQFACLLSKWPKWPDQATTGRIRDLQTKRSFSMMQDFRQSSEAVDLSQVSNMLRELTGQILAHYSSFEIKNTHLRLFRPDQGPHTVLFTSDMMYKKYKWLIYMPPNLSARFCNKSKLVEHKTSGLIFFYFSLPLRQRNTTDKL